MSDARTICPLGEQCLWPGSCMSRCVRYHPEEEANIKKINPSKWATVDASWGEGKKHLCCQDGESFEFYATEIEAIKAAEQSIRSGGGMVAVMEVKRLFIPKPVEYETISD